MSRSLVSLVVPDRFLNNRSGSPFEGPYMYQNEYLVVDPSTINLCAPCQQKHGDRHRTVSCLNVHVYV